MYTAIKSAGQWSGITVVLFHVCSTIILFINVTLNGGQSNFSCSDLE